MKRVNKKSLFILIGTFIITIALFGLFNRYYEDQPKNIKVIFNVNSEKVVEYKVIYDTEGSLKWSDNNSVEILYSSIGKDEKLEFKIPNNSKNIRIVLGNSENVFEVSNIKLVSSSGSSIGYDEIKDNISTVNGVQLSDDGDKFKIETSGDNCFIEINNIEKILDETGKKPVWLNYLSIIGSLFLGYIFSRSLVGLKKSVKFVLVSFKNLGLIKSLSINDFKTKYASSYLGVIWGFIQPLVTIAVYWFVFQVGFRSGDVGDKPFVLWFIAGIIPWFFFSEALSSTTNVFLEYGYLVKKVVFKIEILPVVKIVSALFVHCFFILFIYVIMGIYGYYPDLYSLQFAYYTLCIIVLIFSISVLTSSVVLFFRDLGQIINIVLNVGFWATPIGWQLTMLPEWAARIFKLNPLYYIVTGYRDAFIDKIFFWQRPYETIYFWCFCLITLCVGVTIFNKLRPHFSDVI